MPGSGSESVCSGLNGESGGGGGGGGAGLGVGLVEPLVELADEVRAGANVIKLFCP